MRRLALAMTYLVTLAACGGGGSGSDDPIVGPGMYALTIDASSVCRLPVSHFEWQIEATAGSSSGSGSGGSSVRATLPGGDAAINVSLVTSGSRGGRGAPAGASGAVSGSISTRSVLYAGDTVRVTINGTLTGQLTGAGGTRGRVEGGDLSGTILLTDPARTGTPLGSCTAANHRWALNPL